MSTQKQGTAPAAPAKKTKLPGSRLISGLIVEFLLGSLCFLWLSFLPLPTLYALHYVQPFSLYLAYKLELLSGKGEPESLGDVFSYFNELYESYFSDSDDENPFKFKELSYVLIAIALWNFMSTIELLVIFTILSLSYGHEQAKEILNIPLLILSSLFIASTTHSLLYPLTPLLGIIFFVMAFYEAPSNNNSLTPSELWKHLRRLILQSFRDPKYQLITLLLIASLVIPIIQVTPGLYFLSVYLTHPLVQAPQIILSSAILGEKIEKFIYPSIQKQEVGSKIQDAMTSMDDLYRSASRFMTMVPGMTRMMETVNLSSEENNNSNSRR